MCGFSLAVCIFFAMLFTLKFLKLGRWAASILQHPLPCRFNDCAHIQSKHNNKINISSTFQMGKKGVRWFCVSRREIEFCCKSQYQVLTILLKETKNCNKMSLEPDLNQRPKDICMIINYSPPLYQLSYRGLGDEGGFDSLLKARGRDISRAM